MEAPHLASAEYWESTEIDLRLNPRLVYEADGLLQFLREEVGIEGAVVMATSGSSGTPKFAILPKAALLASAASVSKYLQLSRSDSWLAGLSDYHVGGLGIYARAFVTGASVTTFNNTPWQRDGKLFVKALRESGARWSSLTPTHLFDLVESEVPAPEAMRGLLLGGGRIDVDLVRRASALGWPVHSSYGMTEACSQIATGGVGETEWLPLLPEWETKLAFDQRLMIRGKALFAGYATRGETGWRFDPARDGDGWFLTGDCAEISEGCVRHQGRADDLVKVLGELVSLSVVESAVSEVLGRLSAVLAFTDARRGHEFLAVVEGTESAHYYQQMLNASLTGLHRVSRVEVLRELPRTDIGKIDRSALRRFLSQP
ncbi:MAG: AMP-binding protein [Verrucomicrobiales bacterium]|nr:AMP-binding protein [Verrucomicrobiales bacterium]